MTAQSRPRLSCQPSSVTGCRSEAGSHCTSTAPRRTTAVWASQEFSAFLRQAKTSPGHRTPPLQSTQTWRRRPRLSPINGPWVAQRDETLGAHPADQQRVVERRGYDQRQPVGGVHVVHRCVLPADHYPSCRGAVVTVLADPDMLVVRRRWFIPHRASVVERMFDYWRRPMPARTSTVRRGPATRDLLAIMVMGLLIVLTGCQAPEPVPATSAGEALHKLRVVDRPSADSDYRRAAFGSSWADLDRDGCNTRDQVLYSTVDKRWPHRFQRQGRCRTDMVAGTWVDLYSQQEMTWTNLKDPTQAQQLPLDHILSLAEAWRHGARDWTFERRRIFANDHLNLTPTTAEVNQAKGDQDPASWNPPSAGRCAYATRYISVKARYALPVDRLEKVGLKRLLASCPG